MHGNDKNETCVRTPLIIKGPGFPENFSVDDTVANLDIVPTILEQLSIPIPVDLPGTELQEIVADGGDIQRLVFGEECYDNADKFVVQWPYKCVLNTDTNSTQLYNLERDRFEHEDISSEHPNIVDRLSGEFISNVIGRKSAFIVYFVGDPDDRPMEFSGTFTLPGGIDGIKDFSFSDSDSLEFTNNEIKFNLAPENIQNSTLKILVIYPARGFYDMDAVLTIDGHEPGDRFYPYGTSEADTDGVASIDMTEMSWPSTLPEGYRDGKSGCFIVMVPGIDPDEDIETGYTELSEETIEQLKSLGYLN